MAGALVLVPAGASLTATAARASQQARQLPGFGNPRGHAFVPAAGRAVNTSHPTQVIGTGTPGSCTSAAVVEAVAKGGIITFNCGLAAAAERDQAAAVQHVTALITTSTARGVPGQGDRPVLLS